MDDQQHALSALLLVEPILEAGMGDDPPRRDSSLARAGSLAAVLALAVLIEQPRDERIRIRSDMAAVPAWPLAVVAGLVAALVATPLLDAVDVSPPTFRIAAGVVLLIVASTRLVVPLRASDGFGPAAVVVAAAAGAELDVIRSVVAVAGAALLLGLLALWPGASRLAPRAVRRLVAVAAVIAAVDLVLDGVLAV
jgi:hypothetical protein